MLSLCNSYGDATIMRIKKLHVDTVDAFTIDRCIIMLIVYLDIQF